MLYRDYLNQIRRVSAGCSAAVLGIAGLSALVRHWRVLEGTEMEIIGSEVRRVVEAIEGRYALELEREHERLEKLCDELDIDNTSPEFSNALPIVNQTFMCISAGSAENLIRAYDFSLNTAEYIWSDKEQGILDSGQEMDLGNEPGILREIALQMIPLQLSSNPKNGAELLGAMRWAMAAENADLRRE